MGGRQVGQGSLRTQSELGAFLGFLSSLTFLLKLMILLFRKAKDAQRICVLGPGTKRQGTGS